MIARPELGQPVPFTALGFTGYPCRTQLPGSTLTCCLAYHHEETFHVAYEVRASQMTVCAVWDRADQIPVDAGDGRNCNAAGPSGARCGLRTGHEPAAHRGVDPLGHGHAWTGSAQ